MSPHDHLKQYNSDTCTKTEKTHSCPSSKSCRRQYSTYIHRLLLERATVLKKELFDFYTCSFTPHLITHTCMYVYTDKQKHSDNTDEKELKNHGLKKPQTITKILTITRLSAFTKAKKVKQALSLYHLAIFISIFSLNVLEDRTQRFNNLITKFSS